MDTVTNKIIAILSGKGGTGKTLVSVNLACSEANSTYVDCDVEEPNGHLFLKPIDLESRKVGILIPAIDNDRCNGCKKCVDFCRFNALAYTNKVLVFEDVCHYCGGCSLVCPEKAITEVNKNIGYIQIGKSLDVTVISGFLNVGGITGVPIIKKMEENYINRDGMIFIDCPPGSSCAVMESINKSDYCILVAEPTIFGSHNLDMVYKLIKLFNKPCGVVLNKSNNDVNPSLEYCKNNNIPIIASIPDDNELGKINSSGDIIVRISKKYKKMFSNILKIVKEQVL
jgi:MinD superfamily P-loop ATPase